MPRPAPTDGSEQFRWRLAGDDGGQVPLLAGAERHQGRGELAGLELLHVQAKTIINRVPDASPVPFRWTINPYRGCSHACVYCFARPTHEYLGFDIGQDFDRRIVVKVNAVERLRAELRAPRWAGEEIAMGTNTDPYQPVEGRYRLTRGVIEVLTEAANPFSILTKSTLIGRDVDLLAEARDAHRGRAPRSRSAVSTRTSGGRSSRTRPTRCAASRPSRRSPTRGCPAAC